MRRLVLSVAILGFTVFSILGAADTEFVKGPPYARSRSPELTFSGDGRLWLVWSSFQHGQSRLAVSIRDRGIWSDIEYPDMSSIDQLEPLWSGGSFGEPSLIYAGYDGRSWSVYQVDRENFGWGKPYLLGRGSHPTAAVSGKRLWTAWVRDDRIVIRGPAGPDSAPQIREIEPASPTTAFSHPRLGAGPRGEIWLVWTASRHGYQSVRLQRIDEEIHPALTVDTGSGINRHPRISIDGKGRVWIAYEALASDPAPIPSSDEPREKLRYVMDKSYQVEFPSRSVVVTDGRNWWRPEAPSHPAPGLMPNIHCAGDGTVWVLSRAYSGTSRPYKEFFPLCESLGPEGWIYHAPPWPEQRGTKESVGMAESRSGEVWAAWIPNDRIRLGSRETPSWTFLDGEDAIAVSRMLPRARPGLPVLTPISRERLASPEPPDYPRYQTTHNGQALQVYFGDLHQHSEFSGCGRRNGRIDQNQHYTRHVRGLDFICTIDHAEHMNDHDWHITQLVALDNNAPGKFVTFTGFEWTSEFDAGGNLYRGHYNVIFRDVGKGGTYFSASDPRTNTPLELWNALRKAAGAGNFITFPHHPSRRMAWISWNYYDPDMVPLIEIAQSRGSYEYEGCFSQQIHLNDCSRVSGHYIHDGLTRGMRWGFIAAGDHGGRQLTAVFSPQLEREALFRNLKNRRAYATNGERMFLDLRINGHFMGEEFRHEGDRKIVLKSSGTTPLIQIDLFRNGRILRQWNPADRHFQAEWVDREPLLRRENHYYLRAIQEDGGQAWSSPIWIIDPGVEGRFRFQVGGDELRVIYPDQETDFAILMHNETDEAVKGRVQLFAPSGWQVAEAKGIEVHNPAGTWRYAVFHVTAPASSLTGMCLPEVTAAFIASDGRTWESPLFVVGSPAFISREQKAVLIDARRDILPSRFPAYLQKMAQIWGKED